MTNSKTHSTQVNHDLITFALFAYNQELYIREAIEGIFAQTYQPLEIILSDDYSTDQTFEIMREMANSYKGPHNVRLNRTPENLGVLRHLLNVVRQSHGKLFIGAAGDDISLLERASVLANSWNTSGAKVLTSSLHRINQNGLVVSRDYNALQKSNGFEKYFKDSTNKITIGGASSAYDISVLLLLPEPKTNILFEDICTSFIINRLNWKRHYIDQPLMFYRESPGSISNKPKYSVASEMEIELKKKEGLKQKANLLEYILLLDQTLVDRYGEEQLEPIDRELIKRDLEQAIICYRWDELTLKERINSALSSVGNIRLLKWKIERIWGSSPTYGPRIIVRNLIRKIRDKLRWASSRPFRIT